MADLMKNPYEDPICTRVETIGLSKKIDNAVPEITDVPLRPGFEGDPP